MTDNTKPFPMIVLIVGCVAIGAILASTVFAVVIVGLQPDFCASL